MRWGVCYRIHFLGDFLHNFTVAVHGSGDVFAAPTSKNADFHNAGIVPRTWRFCKAEPQSEDGELAASPATRRVAFTEPVSVDAESKQSRGRSGTPRSPRMGAVSLLYSRKCFVTYRMTSIATIIPTMIPNIEKNRMKRKESYPVSGLPSCVRKTNH